LSLNAVFVSCWPFEGNVAFGERPTESRMLSHPQRSCPAASSSGQTRHGSSISLLKFIDPASNIIVPEARYALNQCVQALTGSLILLLLVSVQATLAASSLWTEKPVSTQAPVALATLNRSLQEIASELLPAVVSLKVQTRTDDAALPDRHPPLPETPNHLATGSGFIIRSDGLILTNDHVVEDGIHIDVHLYDGRTVEASILGRDAIGDLALLKVEVDRPLPVVPLGSSSRLQVGEFVAAFGSPFGFEHTMTFGVVSALKRRFMRSGVVGGYIQTDASINTGNSGGPLVNMRGEVVGINTATVGRGELGFAIPSDAIKTVLPQLYSGGNVRRGYLGVQIRPLDLPKASELGMMPQSGVYVHDVLSDNPAQQAGILAGDVITQFDGARIATPLDLQSAVAGTPVGKTVQGQVRRKQAIRTVKLTVGEMPRQ
jgi:serine protease Do